MESKIGQPVVSNEGLIGSIINVGPNSSRVLLLIDINSMIQYFYAKWVASHCSRTKWKLSEIKIFII